MAKEAIILAGGVGSRLQSVISEIPKPLAPIKDIPFLTYILELCKKYQYDKVILSVGHLHEKIMGVYGKEYKGIELIYAIETERLGTGGAINYALEFCSSEQVLILNGDSIIDINIDDFFLFHTENDSLFSLALKRLNKFDRYGSVKLKGNIVQKFNEKTYTENGLINAGVYFINRNHFKKLGLGNTFSFEKSFLENYFDDWDFYGFISKGFFIDIGIPEDYELAQILLPREFEMD